MTNLRRQIRAGLLGTALTLALLLTALTGFEINGAIVANGELRTTIARQPVRHPSGGRVAQAFVTEGQRVRAGQPLLQLERPEISAEIARLSRRTAAIEIEIARLSAERDQTGSLQLDPDLAAALSRDPDLINVLETHRGLLAERLALEQAFENGLRASQTQLDAEISGLTAQIEATERQNGLIAERRRNVAALLQNGLARASQLSDLQREQARLDGQLAQLTTQKAQARQRRAAVQIERVSARATAREAATSALAQLERDHLALSDRLAELRSELSAAVVYAPFDGWVSDSMALSNGAILGAGQTAMVIIPQDQNLVVQARIVPRFARQISEGQSVWFRLAGANVQAQSTWDGTVTRMSRDAFYDDAGENPYFIATIAVPEKSANLTPGTPAEVFFTTPTRSVWTYLTDPVRHYFNRALRET